jgi:hypothetical protein
VLQAIMYLCDFMYDLTLKGREFFTCFSKKL